MTNNPYQDMPADPVIVQDQEIKQTVVADTNGDARILASSVMTVVVTPDGQRRFVTTDTIVRTDDGRIVDPTKEQVYRCACGCRMILSKHSVVFCERCQDAVRRDHTNAWNDGRSRMTVCPSCYDHGWWSRLLMRILRWLRP